MAEKVKNVLKEAAVEDFVKEYYHTRIKKRQTIHQKQS